MSGGGAGPLPGYGAPDTEPQDPAYAEAAAWPKVLGIAGIVYAALAFCLNGFGSVGLLLNERLQKLGGIDPVPVPPELRMSGLLSVACGVLLSLLLLAGGISLVRRRPAGVTLMGWWAGLAVVTTVVFAVWSVRLQPISDDMQARILAEQKRVMEKAGQKIPPWMDGGTANKVIQYSVMGIPLIFPLITAFILTSEKRRAQVRTWDQA